MEQIKIHEPLAPLNALEAEMWLDIFTGMLLQPAFYQGAKSDEQIDALPRDFTQHANLAIAAYRELHPGYVGMDSPTEPDTDEIDEDTKFNR